MCIVHLLAVTIDPTITTHGGTIVIVKALLFLGSIVAAFVLGSTVIVTRASRLQLAANKIYSRMHAMGLNETELSERCSLAAVHMFEGQEWPALTRDRISKILMNRQENPAKSAARIITHSEFAVLANVLKVSIEWLMGQDENRDPVVWNVLAQPDRVLTFANLLQEYEGLAKETLVWSQHPMHSYTSQVFAHAFNQVHFGQKQAIGNTRALVEFSNNVDRVRRKWLLRPDRTFEYTNLIYQSHFELVVCGLGIFSAISKTILTRNLDVMIEVLGTSSLKLNLLILKDENLTLSGGALGNYEILGSVDNLFSVWNYHNCDIGWSEHPSYVNPHRQLLESLRKRSLFENGTETVEYLQSLRERLVQR